jgi:hypothetical protein
MRATTVPEAQPPEQTATRCETLILTAHWQQRFSVDLVNEITELASKTSARVEPTSLIRAVGKPSPVGRERGVEFFILRRPNQT